jgi:hypothetical protein
MHVRYALPALLTALPLMTDAQVVTLKDEGGNVVNAQTVTIIASTWPFEMECDLTSTLTGSSDKVINVRRYELNTVAGTQNYFCWGVCYLPQNSGALPVWTSADEVNMTPGTDFTGFHAYYKPNGISASTGFRFVWYDTANPTDTTWVDIYFNTQFVGVPEGSGRITLNAYPNPASGGEVVLEHGAVTNGELVVCDVLGNTVLRRTIGGNQRTRFNVNGLAEGVYYATLRSNGDILATRRIAVIGR